MNIQKHLFEQLKSKLPTQLRLVDNISELLEISTDSAYRRIRGEKELTFSELDKLCNHFNISMDEILNHQSDKVIFREQLVHQDTNNYYSYIRFISESLTNISSSDTKELYYIAKDIPIFHYMPFPDLILFKVYVWHRMCAKEFQTYEKFTNSLDHKILTKYYKGITTNYRKIPSIEVWGNNALDSTLYFLDLYYDLNSFENPSVFKQICKQLLQVLSNIESWADNEMKGPIGSASFRMYFSPVDPENSITLTKNDGVSSASINLFMMNSITTTSQPFCMETEKWIKNTISNSLYLSGSSQRERFSFFQSLKSKINDLINKTVLDLK